MPPEEIVAPASSQRPSFPASTSRTADYEQYAIGNADFSAQLRDAFDLTGGGAFALASEIVPVFAVSARDLSGTRYGAQMGTNRQAIAGEVGVVGLANLGTTDIIVRQVRHASGAGRVQMRQMDVPISFAGSTGGGNEAMGNRERDLQRAYPNVHGVSGHALPANMPAAWDNNFTSTEIESGGAIGEIRTLDGPWLLHAGERLVIFPMSANVAVWGFFIFE